ncbi:MAG: hypothetical protein J6336_04115 [Kiritimatiellae bacterium]|nr:hypothetical protein [Kiritimatiellia bacterium]
MEISLAAQGVSLNTLPLRALLLAGIGVVLMVGCAVATWRRARRMKNDK